MLMFFFFFYLWLASGAGLSRTGVIYKPNWSLKKSAFNFHPIIMDTFPVPFQNKLFICHLAIHQNLLPTLISQR